MRFFEDYHIMSFKFKSCLITLLSLVLFVPSTTTLFSDTDFTTDGELTLYPAEGSIEQGEELIIDVLVDTKGQEVVLVRAVVSFNPEIVQLDSILKNEDLFCDWPSGEQLLDNDEGIVMVTGFCQSGGNDPLYATFGEADVFARFRFSTLQAGELRMDWEYSGFDEPMKSVIMADGSPPQNILVFDEDSLTHRYTVTPQPEEIVEQPRPEMPDTNIPVFENISSTFVLGSCVFVLAFLTNILLDPKRRYFRKSRTIVVYDDEEK